MTVGNRPAISRRLKATLGLSATSATGRRLVAHQTPTSSRPPCDHQKTFLRSIWSQRGFTCSNQKSKTSSRPNCPCDLAATSTTHCRLRCPCNLSATTQNDGRKAVADRLQAICDRVFKRVKQNRSKNGFSVLCKRCIFIPRHISLDIRSLHGLLINTWEAQLVCCLNKSYRKNYSKNRSDRVCLTIWIDDWNFESGK